MIFSELLSESEFLKFTGSMSEVFVTIGKLPVSKHTQKKDFGGKLNEERKPHDNSRVDGLSAGQA